jgi:hypothetical protein
MDFLLVFPDILNGLEQWWCWARDWRLFRASPSDCEGFLSLSRGSSRIGYSSGARGLKDLHLVSGCAAPAESLTLDNQLAHDPSSECIARTRSSLPGSKWTSVKKSYVISCRGFSFWLCVIDSLDTSHLYTVGIRTNSPPFTFLHYILSSVLRVVYII